MKVIRLGADRHCDECHEYPEALIVTDGSMSLIIDGARVAVKQGGMYVVPPGVQHCVDAGSSGTLVIVE